MCVTCSLTHNSTYIEASASAPQNIHTCILMYIHELPITAMELEGSHVKMCTHPGKDGD